LEVQDQDLIQRLSSQDEGILAAELDLSRCVSVTVERPNKTTHSPLKRVACSRILADADGKIRLDAIETTPPSTRGVWHPAFLEVIQRNIKIQLYRSRKYDLVRRLAIGSDFRYLSAGALLGESDFLFRIYQPRLDDVSCSDIPYFRPPKDTFD